MIRVFILALFVAFSAQTIAQVETGKPVDTKNELGLEVTNFYGLLNADWVSNNPYSLTFRRHYGTSAMRIGAGGRVASTSSDPGGDSTATLNDHGMNLSAGYERQMWFGKRWGFYYGADLTFARFYTSVREKTPDFERFTGATETRVGIAPLAGFRFRLNKRLSLGTTASYWFGGVFNTTQSNFTNFQNSNFNFSGESSNNTLLGEMRTLRSLYILFDF